MRANPKCSTPTSSIDHNALFAAERYDTMLKRIAGIGFSEVQSAPKVPEWFVVRRGCVIFLFRGTPSGAGLGTQ
jgi:hypothetical protein